MYVRVHATCAPLHQPVCTYTFATRMTTLRTLRPGGSRLSGTSFRAKMSLVGPNSKGETFFREIRLPVRWVPTVRWRNHYFPRNKEALPCCVHGPSCQPLHVQYSSDGSCSLTMLTTLRREHQGDGRRRSLGRGRHDGREESAVVSHAEGSTTV